MKKIFFSLVLLAAINIYASAGLFLVNCSEFSTEMEFVGGAPTLAPLATPRGEFVQITLDGAAPSGKIGKPELPVLRTIVEIPEGTQPEVRVRIDEAETLSLPEMWLPGYVYPHQAPVPKIPNPPKKFVVNWKIYSSDEPIFRHNAEIIDISRAKDHRIALLEFRPINYIPSKGKIIVIKSAKISVLTPNPDLNATYQMKYAHHSIYYDEAIRSDIINYDFWNLWVPPTDIEMLIITGDAFADELSDLVHWKRRKGFVVDIRTASELGGTAAGIKNYIQSYYDSADVDFVLLVGDVDDVPTFTGGASGSSSDNPYSELAGGDYIPDCFVGRLSLTTEAQVSEMVERIINYEHFAFGTGTDWTRAVCLPASDDASYHELAENTQRYVAQTHFGPYGYTRIDTIWAYYGGTGDDVINSVNQGVMILDYTGHGYNYGWAGPEMSNSDIPTLTNTGMYPFVISNACQTGMFGEYDECFMECWIRQTGRGAIASLGASDYTYWNEDDEFERRMIDSAFVSEWMFTGGMRYKGLMAVYSAYSSSAEYYFDMYNLFGDPSLALWFGPPSDLNVSHPVSILPGDGNVNITVTSGGSPVDEALVCITDDGAIHSAGYTNSSGEITLSYSGATAGETLWVTVTAYNKIPYEGFVVVGANGPYVAYYSHSIVDNGSSGSSGDGDGVPDAQEKIAVLVTVRNSGTGTAYSVSGVLSEDSPFATITDSSANFGTIPAGGTATASDPFVIQLTGTPPDSAQIPLTLTTTDAAGSTWTSQFSIYVRAPQISLASYSLTEYGDGDGFFEPGEDVGITVNIHNSGGDLAHSVSGTISESDEHIAIIMPSDNFGDIAPDSTAGVSSYRIHISPICPTPHTAKIVHTATESRGYSATDTITITIGTGGIYDDAESGISLWNAQPPWHITDYRSNSRAHSFYCGTETGDEPFQYPDSTDASLTVANPVLLTENPILTFWHFYETEYNYDSCFVEISTDDGATWQRLLVFNGPSQGWKFASADLSAYGEVGDPILLRFRFNSDRGVHDHGWFVDDVEIGPERVAYLGAGDVFLKVGAPGDTFTFTVTYASPGGTLPLSATVYVDGTGYEMTDAEGTATAGRKFSRRIPLGSGVHSFYFEVNSASGTFRYPQSETLQGPFVAEPLYSYNFGVSDGGFTTESFDFYQDWEWGTPTFGPSSVPYGANCWGTQLASNYHDSSQSRLESPEITIPADGDAAYLVILHWYRMQAADIPRKHDGANVKISVDGGAPFVLFPQSGYQGNASQYNKFIPYQPIFGDTLHDFWHRDCFNLTPWIGHNIRIYFDFGSSSRNTEAGWYINTAKVFNILPSDIETENTAQVPQGLVINVAPNPFNSACRIDAPQGAKVSIYDIRGRKVCEFPQNDGKAAELIWSPGRDVPAGIYLIKATLQSRTATARVIYLK